MQRFSVGEGTACPLDRVLLFKKCFVRNTKYLAEHQYSVLAICDRLSGFLYAEPAYAVSLTVELLRCCNIEYSRPGNRIDLKRR